MSVRAEDAARRQEMSRTLQLTVAVLAGVLASACVHQEQRAPSSGAGVSPPSVERRAEYASPGSGHLVRSVTPDGQVVTLEDGSRWEVEPSGRLGTADWQPDAPVTVRPSRPVGPYSYELTNTQEDEAALARYLPR